VSAVSLLSDLSDDDDDADAEPMAIAVATESVAISPTFDRRKTNRRELLKKAQLNITECRRRIHSDSSAIDEAESKEFEAPPAEDTECEEDAETKEDDGDGDGGGDGDGDGDGDRSINGVAESEKPTNSMKLKPEPIEVDLVPSTENVAAAVSAAQSPEIKIPADFLCPISKTLMNDAVMAADGRMYDRVNIEKHFERSNISPVLGTKLRHQNLMPFNELSDKITRWKMKHRVCKRRRRKRRKRKKAKSSVSEVSALAPCAEGSAQKELQSAECGVDSSDTC